MTNPTAPLRTIVITASIRAERIGGLVTDWVAGQLADRAELDLSRIDLASTTLPDDALLVPGGGDVPVATSAVMEDADAFIIVTPEYNRSIPASLKRFIDWHYNEWPRKAMLIVSYGAGGGVLAGEHLRSISGELGMVAARTAPAIAAPWDHLIDGNLMPPDYVVGQLAGAADQLIWWARAARDARAATSA